MQIKELHVGDVVDATFRTNPASELFTDVYIPVKVIKEYEHFWVCEVLPHENPKHSWGISHPYIMTIAKFDLEHDNVRCKHQNN